MTRSSLHMRFLAAKRDFAAALALKYNTEHIDNCQRQSVFKKNSSELLLIEPLRAVRCQITPDNDVSPLRSNQMNPLPPVLMVAL